MNKAAAAFIGLIIIAGGWAAVNWAAAARAQNTDATFSLTVSPVYANLETTPGSSTSTEIRLRNNTATPLPLLVGLMRFRPYDESGKPELLPIPEGDPFPSWVTFSSDSLTVAPLGTTSLTVSINVPTDAALGYYYAVTFTNPESEVVTEDASTLIGSSAVLLLLQVTTDGIRKDLASVTLTTDRYLYDFLPVTLRVALRNTGNIHVAPRGNIFIDRGNSKDIAILDVNADGGNILPDSGRAFAAVWNDGFPRYQLEKDGDKIVLDKKGQPVKKIEWNFADANKVRFGKYTANLLMVFDNGFEDIPITGTVSFWVVPWQFLLAFLALLGLAVVGIVAIVRRLSRFRRKNPYFHP